MGGRTQAEKSPRELICRVTLSSLGITLQENGELLKSVKLGIFTV